MRHTPGPWIADIRTGMFAVYPESRAAHGNGCLAEEVPDEIVRASGKGERDCPDSYRHLTDEQEANARLIAAAPELASCLEAMLKITCGNCEGGDGRCVTADGFDACLVARQAKAVLAKAKGE